MYLKDLTTDEKKAYIKLALLIISADNEISQKELDILEHQKREMGDLEIPKFDDLEHLNVSELLKSTSNSTFRKIYFELLLIAFSDDFDSNEVEILNKISNAADITDKERAKFEICAKAVIDTFSVVDRLVAGK